MAEDLAEQEARELKQALALSLEEFQTSQGQSPQQQPSGRRESSEPGPSQVKEPPKPGGGGGGGGRRRRKPPPFAPSDAEVDACFKELVSGSRDRIRIDDLVETGTKLGLDIDAQKAAAMLAYLGEQGVTRGVGGGGLTLQDFQAIVRHFRVE